jgi:hypothetical protein
LQAGKNNSWLRKVEADLNKKSINWFIPPVGKGSGGHLNIFRFIRNLENLGYQNRIIIVGIPQTKSAAIAKKNNHAVFVIKAMVFVIEATVVVEVCCCGSNGCVTKKQW